MPRIHKVEAKVNPDKIRLVDVIAPLVLGKIIQIGDDFHRIVMYKNNLVLIKMNKAYIRTLSEGGDSCVVDDLIDDDRPSTPPILS